MSAFPFTVSEEQPPDSIKPSQLWEAQLFAFVQTCLLLRYRRKAGWFSSVKGARLFSRILLGFG